MSRRVLILCTGNSARSQMAEGLLRELASGAVEVHSAGTEPSSVHPLAIRVMAEHGIDIRRQRSKHLDEFIQQAFDDVITVCDRAAETCPVFPGGGRRLHWSLPDPAAVPGGEAERLTAFRTVRDALEERLRSLLSELDGGVAHPTLRRPAAGSPPPAPRAGSGDCRPATERRPDRSTTPAPRAGEPISETDR